MTKSNQKRRCRMVLLLLLVSIVLPASGFASGGGETEPAKTKGLEPILDYISKSWDTLTRSMEDCSTVVDPKLAEHSVLYLPAEMPISAQVTEMQRRCHVQVKALPRKIDHPGQIDTSKLDPPGLLYLEHKYVVPGGRFNEMYGWDSYFIVRGLVRDGRIELAKGMIENFFFEIEHYGTVLNANRSYYLSRSQPPFLTSMILAVYDAQKAAGNDDKKWLQRAYSFAAKDWEMWAREPHLAGDTGLARYYDFGDVGGRLRDSGFDVSFRFGLHGAASHHYAGVGLNSLLYRYEKDLQAISAMLGNARDAGEWKKRAKQREEKVQQYWWDAQRGF